MAEKKRRGLLLDDVLPQAQRTARSLLSLDPQEDVPASQQALEMALGFVPGIGQAMALRDIERARRANDPAAAAMAAASFVPFGRLSKGIRAAPESKVINDIADASDYRMSHRPMSDEGGASRLHNAYQSFGEDLYSPNALQYFGSGDAREKRILSALQKLKDNPDAEVTIYRGVPSGASNEIGSGDWVTLDKSVAQEYGPKLLAKKVKAKDVTTWPDSLLEFGYYPRD